MRKIRVTGLALVLAAVLLLPSVAGAQIDQFSIARNVELGPGPYITTALVTIQCTEGLEAEFYIYLTQAGRPQDASGNLSLTCTGQPQTVEARWNSFDHRLKPGKASATGALLLHDLRNGGAERVDYQEIGPVDVRVGASPTKLGGTLCATRSKVSVEILKSESGYTSELLLVSPRRRSIGLDSDTGTTVTVGGVVRGAELVFAIKVRATGEVFRTGPGTRNPDRLPHAALRATGDGSGDLRVGFEDELGQGDQDFNDVLMRVRGASMGSRCAGRTLTATRIRIGDHPAFVRVVVDFSGGHLLSRQVDGTDLKPFSDGVARLTIKRRIVRTRASAQRGQGVQAEIARTADGMVLDLRGTPGCFRHTRYFVLRHPERLVTDLYKTHTQTRRCMLTSVPRAHVP